ncbi:hypothetical protein D3C78_1739190 [compost metagenome]
MGAFKQIQHKVTIVASEHPLFVITFVHQKVEPRVLAGKRHAVGAHVGGKKSVHRLCIFPELNMPLAIVEVKHGIQRVVIR